MKALLADRSRRGLLLRRQRPRRLGSGDRQPGRAGRRGARAGHRPLLRQLGRAGRGVRRRRRANAVSRGLSDRSGGGRGGAARRHARIASAPSSSSTPTRRAARPATSPRSARAIDAAGHPALFVVDVVASLAAAPFAMDALGVDVAIGASQKGLMVHPGLAFVAADERALAFARAQPGAALLLGLAAPRRDRCRTASSAARRRSPTSPGSRPRSA